MEEAKDVPAFLAKKEGESAEDHVARLKIIKGHVDSMLPEEQAEPQEAKPAGEEEPKPAPAAQESARPAVMTAEDLERNTIAVKAVMSESGLPAECYSDTKITKLAKMSFTEAKAIIDGDAKLAASILRESGIEPVASLRHTAKTKESTGGRKAAFLESFQEEN